MSKRRDEKIKLLANALNGAAGSCFTVGVIAPTVAVLINLGDAQAKVTIALLALNAAGWLFAAAILYNSQTAIEWTRRMTAEVIFVSVVLPALVVVGGWIAAKLHDRDIKRTYGH